MKSFLKYLGPIMLLIGTALLTVYYFNNTPENTLLAVVAGLLPAVKAAKLDPVESLRYE